MFPCAHVNVLEPHTVIEVRLSARVPGQGLGWDGQRVGQGVLGGWGPGASLLGNA